jgi:gas vesicle protein
MSKNTGRNFAIGALFAAGVGYLAGLLTAPQSGKETREDIHHAAGVAKTNAEKTLKKVSSELTDLIDTGKALGKEATAAAKSGLTEALAKAQVARAKAHEVLSAVHEGSAGDKELQQAITDAKKAAEHLQKFVSNTAANAKKAV